MRSHKILITSLFLAVLTISCEKDDDGPETVQPRDRGEQELEDQQALEDYLNTHTYNYEDFENPSEDFDYTVRFDTINEANADRTPIMESDLLETETVLWEGVEYTVYILKIREGAGEQPRFTDDVYFSYRGELLDGEMFDNSVIPVWFNLVGNNGNVPGSIPGFSHAFTKFRGASGFVVNPDNTVTWENDFGVGAVFLPSGLGYFSRPQGSIPAYSPLIFSFNLMQTNEADHDRDGVPSWMEDLNEDGNVINDDTDEDRTPNFADSDDDGDFIPTRDEIEINEEDGTIILIDTNNDGTPDYLDPVY